jgi:quercetin dioxygenase-like cupin family protein
MADDPAQPTVQLVDVGELLAGPNPAPRVLWSASNQLQTNLVALEPETTVPPHLEPELDVTLTVLVGSLELRYEYHGEELSASAAAPCIVVLPAGTRRSLAAGPDGAVYLTAHRARSGLLPRLPSEAAHG